MQLMHKSLAVTVEAPELFARPDFQAWLNSATPKFTWHTGGKPGEFSDVIALVEPNLEGDGSDSDMPGFDQVLALLRTITAPNQWPGHITVRLVNAPPSLVEPKDQPAVSAEIDQLASTAIELMSLIEHDSFGPTDACRAVPGWDGLSPEDRVALSNRVDQLIDRR